MNLSNFFNGMNAVGVARKTEEERLADKSRQQRMEEESQQAAIRQSEALAGQYDATAANMESERLSREANDPLIRATNMLNLDIAKRVALADLMKQDDASMDSYVSSMLQAGKSIGNDDPEVVKYNQKRKPLMEAAGYQFVPYDVNTRGKHIATSEDMKSLITQFGPATVALMMGSTNRDPKESAAMAEKTFVDIQNAMGIQLTENQIAGLKNAANWVFKTQLPSIVDDMVQRITAKDGIMARVFHDAGPIDEKELPNLVDALVSKYKGNLPSDDIETLKDIATKIVKTQRGMDPATVQDFAYKYATLRESQRAAKVGESLQNKSLEIQKYGIDKQYDASIYGANHSGGGYGGYGGAGTSGQNPLAPTTTIQNQIMSDIDPVKAAARMPEYVARWAAEHRPPKGSKMAGPVADKAFLGELAQFGAGVVAARTLTGQVDPGKLLADGSTLGTRVSQFLANARKKDREAGIDYNNPASHWSAARDVIVTSNYPINSILNPYEADARIAKKKALKSNKKKNDKTNQSPQQSYRAGA